MPIVNFFYQYLIPNGIFLVKINYRYFFMITIEEVLMISNQYLAAKKYLVEIKCW
jgi:hypothetical protein